MFLCVSEFLSVVECCGVLLDVTEWREMWQSFAECFLVLLPVSTFLSVAECFLVLRSVS